MKVKILIFSVLSILLSMNTNATNKDKKVLVAYFSHSGNTREVAKQIALATDGELYEIKMVEPYTEEYRPLTVRAKKELEEGFRPLLTSKVKNMESYDVVFIGSPCWWGTVAPAVFTFMDSYDFLGKTVVPFMTHEGSGMGHSEADIKKALPKATVLKGLPVRGGNVNNSTPDVKKWVKGLDLF